jgi:hypothetical protein
VRTRRYAFLHPVIKEIFHKHWTHKIRTRPGTALRVLAVHLQVQQGPKDDLAAKQLEAAIFAREIKGSVVLLIFT